MEELIGLTQILNGYRLKQVDIIGNEDSESRYSEFYRLLKDGTIKTEDEAVLHFYGDDATERSFAYRQFKTDFRERLINSLFFIDFNHPNFNDSETATMSIQKEWAAINILFAKGDLQLPTQLAEELLPVAIKFELTEIVVYITDRLKNSYGGQIGDVKKYTYYKRLQKEHMLIWQAEILAKDLYQELRMYYIKSAAHQPEVARVAQRGLRELRPALEKYDTLRLIYYAYIAEIGQYTTVNDFRSAIAVCEKAITAFRKKPYNAQRLINSFMNQKLMCHIRLKENTEAEAIIAETLALQVEGSLSWFKTLEYGVTLAFHTKNYEQAYVIYNSVATHAKFKTLTMMHLEIWLLFKAYLFYLISIGKIKKATLKSAEFVDFKLSKFMNDMSLSGRDNTGMKISVLIIEVALNLIEGKFGKMIDSSDALLKYRQRHLAKSHALYRHNIMIKMIATIPRAGFERTEVKRKTDLWLRNMEKIPIQIDEQTFLSEVMPLEDMWELILESLRSKK